MLRTDVSQLPSSRVASLSFSFPRLVMDQKSTWRALLEVLHSTSRHQAPAESCCLNPIGQAILCVHAQCNRGWGAALVRGLPPPPMGQRSGTVPRKANQQPSPLSFLTTLPPFSRDSQGRVHESNEVANLFSGSTKPQPQPSLAQVQRGCPRLSLP